MSLQPRETVARVLWWLDYCWNGATDELPPLHEITGLQTMALAAHDGDCTKKPYSCDKCGADAIYRKTEILLGVLSPEDGGAQ